MGLTLRLFCLAALMVSLGAPPPVRASRPAPMSRYAVIIVLDGARPDYFRSAPMPNLQWLLRHGVQYTEAFVGQEMASTPPSHATIGTGAFPKRHGVQGFVWTDPRTGLMTRPADTQPLLAGALEQVMTEHPVPSIAARVKEADSRARVLAVSGHKCYAADAIGTPAADYILCALIYHNRWVAQAVGRHRPPPGAINNPLWDVPIPPPSSGFAPAVEQWQLGTEDDWTVRYALWAFRRIHYPRVMMINLPETDVIGHFEPSGSRDETTLMERFDASLGQIIAAYREAGILQRTDFVVTADHGMTRVDRRLPFHVLDEAIQAAGATKVYIDADTGATIGIRELNRARTVAVNVARLGGDAIDVTYYKAHTQRGWTYVPAAAMSRALSPGLLRAYLTLLNTTASAESPDVVAIYAPHVTTGDRPAHGYHWVAGHLGPQWDEQHIPLIVAGPGVRQGVTSSYPARLADIAPTIEKLLGVKDTGTDGVVLQDALTSRSPIDGARQASVGRSLSTVIQALQARSR